MKPYGIGCFDGKLKWMTRDEVISFNVRKDPVGYQQGILHNHHNIHLILHVEYPGRQGSLMTNISITGMDEILDIYGDFVIQRCAYPNSTTTYLPITVEYFDNYIIIKQTEQRLGRLLPFIVDGVTYYGSMSD